MALVLFRYIGLFPAPFVGGRQRFDTCSLNISFFFSSDALHLSSAWFCVVAFLFKKRYPCKVREEGEASHPYNSTTVLSYTKHYINLSRL